MIWSEAFVALIRRWPVRSAAKRPRVGRFRRGCPPGLEVRRGHDQWHLRQRVELAEGPVAVGQAMELEVAPPGPFEDPAEEAWQGLDLFRADDPRLVELVEAAAELKPAVARTAADARLEAVSRSTPSSGPGIPCP